MLHHVCVLALMQHAFVLALMQHGFVLARIRLTRMAAERGPILSGACRPGGGVPQTLVVNVISVCEPPQ
jgi:hypothetical protein